MKRNENCTYLYDPDTRTLYFSLSFEDLTHLEKCNDYIIVNVDDYVSNMSDSILDLIIDVLSDKKD